MRLLERNDARNSRTEEKTQWEWKIESKTKRERENISWSDGNEQTKEDRRRRERRDSFEEETLVGFSPGRAFRQLKLTSITSRVEEKCLCS